MLKFIKKVLKPILKPLLWDTSLGAFYFGRKSYSQEAEDLVVDFLQTKIKFYVDVGCNHPIEGSTTYLFYRKGAQGICIDPLPESKRRFEKIRPRDIFVQRGVSLKPDELTYYMFNASQLNTFDGQLAQLRIDEGVYKLEKTIKVVTESLSSILSRCKCPSEIDLMSVDAEGYDLEVLKSNNWSLFIPKIVIVERLTRGDLDKDELVCFLKSLNYNLFAITGKSLIFQRATLVESN